MTLFYLFINLLNVWLLVDSRIPISASAFNLLQYLVPCSLWKALPRTSERMRTKKQTMSSYECENGFGPFWLCKDLWNTAPHRNAGHTQVSGDALRHDGQAFVMSLLLLTLTACCYSSQHSVEWAPIASPVHTGEARTTWWWQPVPILYSHIHVCISFFHNEIGHFYF